MTWHKHQCVSDEGRRGERRKRGKEFEGERTGTPLRWPPTETSCSWRVYPHHYILARSHAARHSRIMSCFKKKKKERKEEIEGKKRRIIPFFSSSLSSSSLLLNFVCGHVEPRCRTVNTHMQIDARTFK